MVTRVLLASPRGYCAGVERAVETVERALEHYGAPVYVRKQIVHNIHVVRDLEARGAIFVEEETDVPLAEPHHQQDERQCGGGADQHPLEGLRGKERHVQALHAP